MDWLLTSFYWYLVLLFLGLVFFPLTKKFFSSFVDYGYPFSKTIAILLLSYSVFVLGILKILPFTQWTIFLLIGAFGMGSLKMIKQTRDDKESGVLKIILFEEILFFISFVFLTYIRGQEPSVRGLEKFMDFGFINSILRTNYFPPLDMWFARSPINYYYFGHITGALLIKLSAVKPSVGYNLILSTIFAQGMTLAFSLTSNIINILKKTKAKELIFFGMIGAFIVNLGGNLHTIYLFTKGYPNESPIPFWTIFSSFNPTHYWYPNATRFIPFTIHEFPSYSYVVADLHGHVFDIPFVLLTMAILFLIFVKAQTTKTKVFKWWGAETKVSLLLGFMTAVHYMTNAFDGPIYLLFALMLFLVLYHFSFRFFISSVMTVVFFVIFSLPFSINFKPFVSGIGVNCSSKFLTSLGHLGPFLFEKDKCQSDPVWMLFVLWGFFWINFILFTLATRKRRERIHDFIFLIFSLGTILVIIPEFFYIKDIYPAHFRANTMFKLGYQAFMMMGVASAVTMYVVKGLKDKFGLLYKGIFLVFFALIFLYPFYSFPAYYGDLKKPPQLDGSNWLTMGFKADHEIIDYINKNVKGQPTILEAQGDSYTDYERISANTGLPTVAGWWVHEWLWRGSPDYVGHRIPEVASLYESNDVLFTRNLINKYDIEYIIVSGLEREKYKNLDEGKFSEIGKKIFESSDGFGALYQPK